MYKWSLSVCLSICLSVRLSVCLSICLSAVCTGRLAAGTIDEKSEAPRRSKERIVAFLRENFAPDLRGIEMVDRFQRFLVTRGDEERPLDLSQYGDGMQRIFLTALLVAQAEHGVLLMDEFENGVHAGLLAPFARFVATLAREFEVQLFVTTHSAEAVQAFTDAQLGDDLATYALVRGGEAVQAKRFGGPQLRELMDFAGFDLRRVR